MSDAQSGRSSAVPRAVQTRERVTVRRRRSRKGRPSARDAERWLAGTQPRSPLRVYALGSVTVLLLAIVLYLIFR
jgi:hypothetical protein